jgi:uncharacterized Zn finger protein
MLATCDHCGGDDLSLHSSGEAIDDDGQEFMLYVYECGECGEITEEES